MSGSVSNSGLMTTGLPPEVDCRTPARPEGDIQDLALPAGQHTRIVGQYAPSKTFRFTEIRKRRMYRALRPKEEGRIAIVTNAGRTAVDAGHIGAKGFAGRATVSEGLAHTTGVIGVRQNRVVLAPGVCVPNLAVMCLTRP